MLAKIFLIPLKCLHLNVFAITIRLIRSKNYQYLTDLFNIIKVYLKQDVTTIAYNITLSPLGYHRPKAMSDDPVEFLTKHLQHHPYQV